jgi:hypothetical protein
MNGLALFVGRWWPFILAALFAAGALTGGLAR